MDGTKKTPKFVLIGAGSASFGLQTILGIAQCKELRGSEVALVDIAPDRLERMTQLAHRISETWEANLHIASTTDRCEVLPGADIVVLAIERDRCELWHMDREIPRKYGVKQIESENGGPAGAFHTFRQVPMMLEIGRDMERLCPNAWLVNMSNPESRVTLALTRYSKVRNVGVCLGAYITQKNLANVVLGVPQEAIDIKAAGINHCHWVMDIRDAQTGEDLYPEVRRKIETLDPSWEPLSRECLRTLGYYPGPADGHVSEYIGWGPDYVPLTRGRERVDAFAQKATERDAAVSVLIGREGPLHEEELKPLMIEGAQKWQTLDIMLGLLGYGNRYVLSLNIPNEGYITNLKQGGIVEIPAICAADRLYGLGMGELPPAIAALMDLQLRIMDLVVEAAVTGDRKTALEALLIDPAIPNPTAARKILDEMLMAEAKYLPQFC